MLSDEANKIKIKQKIEILSKKIKVIHYNYNICERCVIKLEKVVNEFKEQEIVRKKLQELIKKNKKKNVRTR